MGVDPAVPGHGGGLENVHTAHTGWRIRRPQLPTNNNRGTLVFSMN